MEKPDARIEQHVQTEAHSYKAHLINDPDQVQISLEVNFLVQNQEATCGRFI